MKLMEPNETDWKIRHALMMSPGFKGPMTLIHNDPELTAMGIPPGQWVTVGDKPTDQLNRIDQIIEEAESEEAEPEL
jgi:hypothetical protein